MNPDNHQQDQEAQNYATEPQIGLFDIFSIWWAARARLLVLAMLGGVVAALVVLVAYFAQPSEQSIMSAVRLNISGIENGQYPNGMPFSPQDIVASPVMQKVYENNKLTDLISYADFKNAFSVIESNVAIERLRREFAPKMDDKKLTAIEREKMEEEFRGKAKALRSGEYKLIGVFKSRLSRWTPELAGKVTNDILKTWAEQSRGRGVFKYDINVFSDNLLSDVKLGSDDYLVQIDRLRVCINRVMENLDEMAKLPGANLVRVGDKKVSLGELKVSLGDDLKFKLGLIQSTIYGVGLYKNRTMSEAYINEQLFKLQLDKETLVAKVKVVEDAMNSYSKNRAGNSNQQVSNSAGSASSGFGSGTMIPQFGENFLDRVIDLSTQKTDVEFRQNLTKQNIESGKEMILVDKEHQIYERMLKTLTEANSDKASRAEVEKWVEEQIQGLIAKVSATIVDVQGVYKELSQQALEPATVYTELEPVHLDKVAMTSITKLIGIAGFVWFAYIGAILVYLARKVLAGSIV